MTWRGASAGTLVSYNPASQLTAITRDNDTYAWTGHYNVNRAYGTNGLNQLTSAGATTLGYDLRGNLTSSGSDAYSYTAENRLAIGPGGVTLYYDPTGRMSRLVQGAATTKFEYLGPRLVIERDGAGTILRRYVHGPGDDEPLVWYEGAGLTSKRWLHTDERGSVIAITDTSGASIATNRYDEYGIPQSGNIGRFQYTGQTWVPELGLYYYKARFYSPTLGRFMQADPIGYKDGVNWYAYVDDDPVNRSDPSGLGKVCTAVTGSRIEACVGVDGNGDGNVKDRDLNSSQRSRIESDYRGAILANRGRDISGYGKPVVVAGGADGTIPRVASQFVGAYLNRMGGAPLASWNRVDHIYVGPLDLPSSRGPDRSGRNLDTIGINANWRGGILSTSPSNAARALFHENDHGWMPNNAYSWLEFFTGRHAAIDDRARRDLKASGLGGGGCVANMAFPGC